MLIRVGATTEGIGISLVYLRLIVERSETSPLDNTRRTRMRSILDVHTLDLVGKEAVVRTSGSAPPLLGTMKLLSAARMLNAGRAIRRAICRPSTRRTKSVRMREATQKIASPKVLRSGSRNAKG